MQPMWSFRSQLALFSVNSLPQRDICSGISKWTNEVSTPFRESSICRIFNALYPLSQLGLSLFTLSVIATQFFYLCLYVLQSFLTNILSRPSPGDPGFIYSWRSMTGHGGTYLYCESWGGLSLRLVHVVQWFLGHPLLHSWQAPPATGSLHHIITGCFRSLKTPSVWYFYFVDLDNPLVYLKPSVRTLSVLGDGYLNEHQHFWRYLYLVFCRNWLGKKGSGTWVILGTN